MGPAGSDLIARARAGDGNAFKELTEPYRRELQVHCYRMLGSFQDAEDALQEALLAAWQGLGGYMEERASLCTWLYKIVTNRYLNALRSGRRRAAREWDVPSVEPPESTRLGEVVWLQPYPDDLLDDVAGTPPGPEARYEQAEAISLAFITALQVLPPRQVAVLILRDSLVSTPARWPSCWTRPSRRSTAPSNGPARACSVAKSRPPAAGLLPPLARLLRRRSWPGSAPACSARAASSTSWRHEPTASQRSEPTCRPRASGTGPGLYVLALTGDRICAMVRFEANVLPWFGLPRSLPDR